MFPFRYYFSIPQFTLSGQGQIFSNGQISFSPNAKPGVKRKQENVATKADKRKYEDKRDLRKKKKRLCESLIETETEVTVVDENELEGSDKENEQEEQTEPVNVVEQTDEKDSESERESEMSSSECEMSEEETFRSINRIIEYEIEYVTV